MLSLCIVCLITNDKMKLVRTEQLLGSGVTKIQTHNQTYNMRSDSVSASIQKA